MSANGPQEWFNSLGVVTRWMFTTSLALTILSGVLGTVSAELFYYDIYLVWSRFHVWRLVTSFLYLGGPSIPFVIRLYMFVMYSKIYESDPFNTGGGAHSSDYALMLLFGMGCHIVTHFFLPGIFGIGFFSTSFLMYLVYVNAKHCEVYTPQLEARYFLFKFKAKYLPWVLLAFDVCTGGPVVGDLIGIVLGHVYYVLVKEVPDQYGYTVLKTPRFLFEFFDRHTAAPAPAVRAQAPAAATTAAPSRNSFPAPGVPNRHNWGTGRVLGAGGAGQARQPANRDRHLHAE